MLKSEVTHSFLHVVRALLQDVLAVYPPIRGIDLDFERIARILQTRGPESILLDLPTLDSVLTDGLENGRLVLGGPLTRAVSNRVRVPRLLSGLWLRVFDVDGSLLPDPDVNAIFFIRQISLLSKKLEVECSESRMRTAMEDYYDVERTLRSPTSSWDAEVLSGSCRVPGQFEYSLTDLHSRAHSDERMLPYPTEADRSLRQEDWGLSHDPDLLDRTQQIADLILGSFDQFDPVLLSGYYEHTGRGTGFKHGPGAVFERLKNEQKSSFPSWSNKLERIFPFEDCAYSPYREGSPKNHEPPSRLLFVPKTAKAPRIIASEPLAHMWCQQMIWSFLQTQLENLFGDSLIAFRRQDLSADMVHEASLTKRLATVDLSSASDRLSCWTVERIFRANMSVLSALHAARTRWIQVSQLGSSDFFILKKFASQGTASTFPVQSIVYLCAALASAMPHGDITLDRIRKCRNRVRVYGDDIIIPTHGYTRLEYILTALQLKVNSSKSFRFGHFRESCGSDSYNGFCVTPCKPRSLSSNGPRAQLSLLELSNNLWKKGLWHASQAVLQLVPRKVSSMQRVSCVRAPGFDGLTSFCGYDERHLKQRWNSRYQRIEVGVVSFTESTRTRHVSEHHRILDFWSRPRRGHWDENPRVTSVVRDVRELRTKFTWGPYKDEHSTTVHAA